MIRHRFIPQKPLEVYPVTAGLFQFSCCVDTALVSIYQNFEQHSRIGDRFPSSGRIRCIQFPVIQFLKLGVGQPDRCVFRYEIFAVQCNYLLTVPLNYVTLFLRCFCFHNQILTHTKAPAKSFLDPTGAFVIARYFATRPSDCRQNLAEFAVATANRIWIIYSGGVYVGENTFRPANVRIVRL